jgi:mRNA-degrading endonuclease YafQ of YafQ-DinJ toxin-antitoxin module
MNIKYHKRFEKQFKKLLGKEKERVLRAIGKFIDNPKDPILQNHSLKGVLSGKSAISAGSDLRIIFEEFDDYTLVIFLDLGKHNRVYK